MRGIDSDASAGWRRRILPTVLIVGVCGSAMMNMALMQRLNALDVGGSGLAVRDEDGSTRFRLHTDTQGRVSGALMDSRGVERIVASVTSTGSPSIECLNQEGRVRVSMSTTDSGAPLLMMRDDAGNIRLSVQVSETGDAAIMLCDRPASPGVVGDTNVGRIGMVRGPGTEPTFFIADESGRHMIRLCGPNTPTSEPAVDPGVPRLPRVEIGVSPAGESMLVLRDANGIEQYRSPK